MSCRSLSLVALTLVALLGNRETEVFAHDRIVAQNLVAEALHRQVYGLDEDRDRLLAAALQADANYGPARWHQGFVRVGGGWAHVDAAPTIIGTSYSLAKYRTQRAETEDTLAGNLQLADWCRDRRLVEQERAHLSRVLDFDRNNTDVRERLGFTLVGGQWMHESEVEAFAEQRELWQQSLDDWRTQILGLRSELTSSKPARRERAERTLNEITSPTAIPALESLLSSQSQALAQLVIQAISNMPEQVAVESLVRHAVLSDWPVVREAAAASLTSRPRESYVPLLLAQMYTTVESRRTLTPVNGRLVYQHAFTREAQDQREVLVVDSVYRRRALPGGNGRETTARALADSFVTSLQLEQSAQQQNARTRLLNERITQALNLATQQELQASPQAWWQWWDQQNDVVQQGQKPTQQQQRTRQIVMRDQAPPQFASSGSQASVSQPRRQQGECFVAGTLVWTASGKFPIEHIRVGDAVLSQDINTGELAYKPVLRTTVRPAEQLIKVHVKGESFETSGGHLFWVTGRGWSQARELSAGQSLHAIEGAKPLLAVESGSKAETYNLVVADFNTYVVGESQILSHDVTQRRPTRVLVPGLAAN